MIDIEPIDLAYIAGFFDGEGSITIHHNTKLSPRGKSPNHTLQVSVGNTDPRVILWIHGLFGGSVSKRSEIRPNHRPCLQWIIRSNLAAEFLSAILPFVRMKRKQIDIALKFQKSKGGYRKKMLSVEEIAIRERQRQEIRTLNKANHEMVIQ